MSSRRNLIMGQWSRLGFEALHRFLGTLRRTTFAGDVCLLVDDLPPDVIDALLAHGIIVERLATTGHPDMTALSSRFFSYLDFLVRRGDEYDNVLLTDLRDVVFQSDPFANPLPADIVYAQERCRMGDSPVNRSWLVQGYGDAVAHNMRDCLVACAGTTFGTTSGIIRYLAAMTRELQSCPPPIIGGIDQGVHNYVVHMRPLRNAWLDTTDSLVATLHFMPDAAIELTERGILVDGRLVPVIHQWDRNKRVMDYVYAAPQFRLDESSRPPAPAPAAEAVQPVPAEGQNAVVCFYHGERDAGWLPLFLGSLRCSGFAGPVHCIGAMGQAETDALARHGAAAHVIAPVDLSIAENVAHFHCSQVLDRLAADPATQPRQVLVLDSARAAFARDPFAAATIGLSVFSEGPTRIGESIYNHDRLAAFTPPTDFLGMQPIISSSLLRGRLDVVRTFYRKLFTEFIGRAELLRTQKIIQGAINKLCHLGGLEFPIIVHPNAAEVYFDFWPSGLAIETEHGIRIGQAAPAVVLAPSEDTTLIQAIKGSFRL